MLNWICGGRFYIFWIVFFFVVLLILWFFYGGGSYEFIGLKPITEMPQIPDAGALCETKGICISPSNETRDINVSPIIVGSVTQDYVIPRDAPVDAKPVSPIGPIGPIGPINPVTNVNPVNPRVSYNIPTQFVQYTGGGSSKGEKACQQALEEIFGVPFRKIRPKWLRNPETGRNLELDCYNDSLKIGLEYNSAYHYKYPNAFNKTVDDFIKTVQRDKLKLDLCDQHGVYLITVTDSIKPNKIKEYILSILPPQLLSLRRT